MRVVAVLVAIAALLPLFAGCRGERRDPRRAGQQDGWIFEGWACMPDLEKARSGISPAGYCGADSLNDYLYLKFSAAASQTAIDSKRPEQMQNACRQAARAQIEGNGIQRIVNDLLEQASGVTDGESISIANGPSRGDAPPGQPRIGIARPSDRSKLEAPSRGVYRCCALDGSTGQCAASPASEDWSQCLCVGYARFPGGRSAFEQSIQSSHSLNLDTEAYDVVYENPFQEASRTPLSTFSIDVDTASYSNMRRFLNEGRLPPRGAVRIEELVNYFAYDDPAPTGPEPFAVNTEVSAAPWNEQHRLVRIALAARRMEAKNTPSRNLVFLVDVSGSMNDPGKLPLVKSAMKLLARQLTGNDLVSIAVYAGASGLVLPTTGGERHEDIVAALDRLQAGGSTNGGQGIQLAYSLAEKSFIKGGVNRVILCTDGDFNVGITSQDELVRLIEEKRSSGIFLSVLGFGMGNYKDATMEKLADKGNGNYAYIDTFSEARKVLMEQISGTLVTIAKDVKLQLEFNPKQVKAYRLIGYENRMMRDEDFNNDTKDAGDIGAGHTVMALYEIIPFGAKEDVRGVDRMRYQKPSTLTKHALGGELLTLKIRYKAPESETSSLQTFAIRDRGILLRNTSNDFRFAAGVAAFGMLLRDSDHKGRADFILVRTLAEGARGDDRYGHRSEFIQLVQVASGLWGKRLH